MGSERRGWPCAYCGRWREPEDFPMRTFAECAWCIAAKDKRAVRFARLREAGIHMASDPERPGRRFIPGLREDNGLSWEQMARIGNGEPPEPVEREPWWRRWLRRLG